MSATTSSRRGIGLGPRLLLINIAVIAAVALVLATLAISRLEQSLVRGFTSKGEAIALSLASATEQSVGTSISTIQGSIDSNKLIEGVKYIYVKDVDDSILVHTFSPSFPDGLADKNQVEIGELDSTRRVKVDPTVEFALGDAQVRAIDIAAPVSGGALGVVHVGMDRTLIEQQVAELKSAMMLLGGLLAVLGIALALGFVYFMVIRPIRELTRVTSDIVARGDLTQKIAVRSSDEIGQLAQTFGQMVEKLRQIPTSLSDSAELLTRAVVNLSSSTEQQAQTVTRQATALQETQVTAQEIKQTSLVAAQKAEAVLKVAERAEEIGRAGEAAIEQSLSGLTDIRGQVEEISRKIAELGERTRQIGGITSTVKDLADQSNMLALNAAIEAVRSGEHGKGFAVVAREIRSLADQSIQATNRVREILDDISSAVGRAVAITEKGAQKMESGLVQVKQSGESLRELSNIVKDNSAAVRQIAAAVNQQNAGISQIFTAVTDLSSLMDDTMQRLKSTTAAAETVKDVTGRVSEVVKSYRV